MCSIARHAALGLDAAAFLDRRRGVVAAVAPAARGVMAREPACGVGATQKRSRNDFDGNVGAGKGFAAGERTVVVPAPAGQQRLQERMSAELDAIRGLHRKAVLLCRGAGGRGGAGEGAPVSAAGPRPEAPMEAAAKRVKTSPSKLPPEAAQKRTEPVMKQQEKRPVQSATPPPTKRSVAEAVDKAREALQRRRLEEMARAREKCRQEVLEMERTALPDETIYEQDLLELGIAFQYAVTRTRMQAMRSRLNGGE